LITSPLSLTTKFLKACQKDMVCSSDGQFVNHDDEV